MAVSVVKKPSQTQNSGASATNNPTLRASAAVTAGNYLLAFIAQEDAALPSVSSDTQGNAYRFLGGPDGTSAAPLCGCWYGAVAKSSTRPTLTFATVAPSAFALFELASYQLNSRGGIQEDQVQIVDPSTAFDNGADAINPGDFLASLIIAPQAVSFTVDPSTPGWTDDLDISGASLSAQILHAVPTQAGLLPILWTASVPVTAVLASISIATA